MPDDIISIEDTAIRISTSFFSGNESGEIKLNESQQNILDGCATKGDFEYKLLKQIHAKIDSEFTQN